MSIKADVNELKKIKEEIQRRNLALRDLRKRKNELEARIIEYLQKKEQPGLKFQGEAMVLQSASKRVTKKKDEKKADSISILENYGITNAEKILAEILEAQRGEEVEVSKLKISKIKK